MARLLALVAWGKVKVLTAQFLNGLHWEHGRVRIEVFCLLGALICLRFTKQFLPFTIAIVRMFTSI